MNNRIYRWATIAVAAALVSAGGGLNAYTVVTRDGHVIQAQARPEIRGLQAYMRLAPRGQLAVIQEEMIDWGRTDSANPAPQTIAVPADAKTAKGAPHPVEVRITGAPPAKVEAAPGTPGAPQTPPANAAEAIVKLQKEFALVSSTRDAAVARKKALEAELAPLESREVGYVGEDNSNVKRMNELRQQISEASAEISKYEGRLGDIRSEVVQLGGSID